VSEAKGDNSIGASWGSHDSQTHPQTEAPPVVAYKVKNCGRKGG